jgi:hypothetical protein
MWARWLITVAWFPLEVLIVAVSLPLILWFWPLDL